VSLPIEAVAWRCGLICLSLTLSLSIVSGEESPTDTGRWVAPGEWRKSVNPAASDPVAASRGKEAYGKFCQSCHGDAGRGDGPVAKRLGFAAGDLSDPAVLQPQTDGEIFWKISTGRDPMPGFQTAFALTDAQIWDIVVHVRRLAPPANTTQPRPDDVPPRP